MRRLLMLTLLTAPLLAAPAPEGYLVSLKLSPAPGKGVVVKEHDSSTTVIQVLDANGKPVGEEKKQVESHDETYIETILEAGEKRSRKYKRAYEKATRVIEGKVAARSYEGRTVVFAEKDGKYTVTAEGDKPISDEDFDELTKEANSREEKYDHFLPRGRVKAGDSWKIDIKELARMMEKDTEWNRDLSSGEGKLEKVYDKGGKSFGRIVLRLKLTLKPPPETTYETPLVTEMTLTLDAAIDGSSTEAVTTITAKSAVRSTTLQMGEKITASITGDYSARMERSPEK